MKTATQAGWSLTYTISSSNFQFITARSIDDGAGHYCEFHFDAVNRRIIQGDKNDVRLLEMPVSVFQLIRYWFGTITYTEYFRALRNL